MQPQMCWNCELNDTSYQFPAQNIEDEELEKGKWLSNLAPGVLKIKVGEVENVEIPSPETNQVQEDISRY